MVEALENRSAGREEIDREQRRKTPRAENEHANRNMWSTLYHKMINMWSERSEAQSRELFNPSSAGVVL